MRAYYLESPLTDAELGEVRELMNLEVVDQVRIPHVFPAPSEAQTQDFTDVTAAARLLERAGIFKDQGCRVLLVIPEDVEHYTELALAVHQITGFYPYLVQTAAHRATRTPGPLRVIDMHGLATGE